METSTKRLQLILVFFLGILLSSQAQISQGGKPRSFLLQKNTSLQNIVASEVQIPDMNQVKIMDGTDEKNGTLRKIGRTIDVNYTTQNSGIWETLMDGSKIWRLKLHLNAAKAIVVYYNNFYLPPGSELFLYNENKRQVLGAYTSLNNPASQTFANELVEGETVTLEYFQPAGIQNSPVISINGLGYIYRDYEPRFNLERAGEFGSSGACEVNVNCSEGSAFQNQKRSVVRILVTEGAAQGWCSGALINNTAQNCSPYILTADHCSGNGAATTANLTQWIFYFNYEGPSCADPASEGTLASKTITGCTLKARGGANGSIGSSSDFYLILMSSSPSAAWNPYYAGWNRGTAASSGGVSIHHPAGDIKKISTYTSTLTSSNWSGGTIAGTHWQVVWAATANGTGVTEGGSSGSPIFDNNGRIVGQLSGGSSFCTATTAPDLYGKFSYDWSSNTLPSTNNKLQPWLDPGSTGVSVLDGTNSPCGPSAPVVDFSANNTTPCIGSTVTFTDLSSGSPTSWLWTFSPTSVTYVGATSGTSQNPQVQFNAAGPYSVTLKATNAIGNNTVTKTNYITPSSPGTLPFVQNFEAATFPPTGWSINNPDGGIIAWSTAGAKTWVRRAAGGNTGSTSGCAGINYYDYNTDTMQLDELISKPVSLSGSTNPKMTFKRAYHYYPNSLYSDELRIFVSADCGTTYSSALYYKKGTQLATNGWDTLTFTPTTAANWDIDTVDLSAYVGQNIVVKFQGINKYGNNLYLDDINIASTVASIASVIITSNDADNSICAGTSVTFTAAPTNGGTAPTYQWKVGGTNVGTNSSTYTTTTLTTGQIVTCVMTSNLPGVTGSPATSNAITMTVNPIPATPTAGSNTPVCTGSTINLTTTTATGTYSWTGPGAFTAATQNPARTGATTAMAGTYSVTVTSLGCTSVVGTTTVVINTTPTVAAPANKSICAGTVVSATAFTSTPVGATFVWTNTNTAIGLAANGTGNLPLFTATNSGSTPIVATITVTPTLNGCVGSPATFSITVNPVPATPTAGSNTPVCTGSTINLTTPTATGTYSWTGPGAFTAATQNPVRTGATTAMAGTYSVTITSGSCTSLAGTTTVVVNASPIVTSISNNSVCAGVSVSSTAFTSTPAGATFAWTNSNTAIGLAANGTGNLPLFTAANSGSTPIIATITVTPTLNGCVGSPQTFSITVNPIPAIPTAGNNTPVCSGSTINLTTPTATGTYSWTGPGTFTAGTQNPVRTGATTAMAGTYSVTVTSLGCTSVVGTTTVVINTTPTVAAPANKSICAGVVVSSTAFTSTPVGATFAWTNSNPSIGLAANGTGNLPLFTAANSGSTPIIATITVTPTLNGCAGSPQTFSITVNPTTAVVTGFSYTTPVCANGANPIPVPVAGFTSGGAYNSSAGLTINPSTGVITLASSTPGTYSVTYVVAATGCQLTGSSSTSITINTVVVPVTGFSYTTLVCSNGINPVPVPVAGFTSGGTFSSTAGLTVNASTGAITLSSTTPGTYSVNYTLTSSGCQLAGNSTSTITINPTPATPSISQVGNTLTSSAASGNQWYLNGAQIPGATSQNYNVSANGSYAVQVTTGGCTSTASVPLDVINVGIEEAVNSGVLSIYPNPNDGNFNVSFNADVKSTYTLELTNALGQLIYKEELTDYTGTYTKKLSVTAYGKGVYSIRLTNSKNETVKKIVVY